MTHESSDPATWTIFGNEVDRALASIPDTETELGAAKRLRKLLPAELARRASELRALRRRAQRRFPPGFLPFMTARGLEQASPYAAARHRAMEMAARSPGCRVWDATCGVGADAAAMVASGLGVVASDRSLETARYASANLRRGTVSGRFAVVVAEAVQHTVRADAILLDPDRRAGGRRSLDPAEWSPTLSAALELTQRFGAACIELAPATDPETVGLELPCRARWMSLGGELVAMDLWLGSWADGASALRREIVHLGPDGDGATYSSEPIDVPALTPDQAREVTWFATPDPALVRSGALGSSGARGGTGTGRSADRVPGRIPAGTLPVPRELARSGLGPARRPQGARHAR